MRKGYHWMNRSWKNWGDVSIRLKSTLLMGTVLAVTWTLVVLVLLQLQHFSGESAIIMNKYLDATSFMNTFSTENVCLEAFLRPVHSSDTLNDYLNASAATDAMLERLQPDIQADRREIRFEAGHLQCHGALPPLADEAPCVGQTGRPGDALPFAENAGGVYRRLCPQPSGRTDESGR